jgi:hypothetical protein
MRFGMNIMVFEAIQTPYFLFPTMSNNNLADA